MVGGIFLSSTGGKACGEGLWSGGKVLNYLKQELLCILIASTWQVGLRALCKGTNAYTLLSEWDAGGDLVSWVPQPDDLTFDQDTSG